MTRFNDFVKTRWQALTLLSLLLPLAVFQPGCGASALERHTIVASTLHRVSDTSAHLIETEARATVAELDDPDMVRAAIAARRPLEAAQHVLASSVDGYVTALLLVAADERPDFTDAIRAGMRVLAVYEDVARLAREFGVDLPPLTPVVVRLLGGGL